jgi:heme-degrading monooxygenase HmoA
MFVVLWEFDVKPESEVAFTFAYGSSGEWVRLFRTSASFRETRLLRNISEPLRYITMDIWENRKDYERFLETHAEAYRALDAVCGGLTTSERHLSSFDTRGDGVT